MPRQAVEGVVRGCGQWPDKGCQGTAQGRKQGPWQQLHPNGQVRYEGQFADSKPVGLFKYYFDNGKLSATNNHSADGAVASHHYHPNGKIKAKGVYRTEKKDSLWQYFNENEVLVLEETYKQNMLHGVKRIYFDNGQHKGYYDQEGRPMKSAFLKAPLKYSRISSYYNLNRLHPILKYRRPHYGTDYAAPHGTPIMAVGDGTVSQASYTSGNGNFVKIRHAGAYETQYLHMRGFAKGIRSGARVQQGQIIGYVGSTGLATGPHVCFRFWKNGQQVNHLRLNLPNPEPLPKAAMPEFIKVRDTLLEQMKAAKQAGESEKSEETLGNP